MTLTGKIPPGDPLPHTFNGSFRNAELDTYRIGEKAYTRAAADHLARERLAHHRKPRWANTQGLDMDTEDETPTLPAPLANKFISRHAAIVHDHQPHARSASRLRPVPARYAPIMQATNYARQRRRCCRCLFVPLTVSAKTRSVLVWALAAILSSRTSELLATMKQIIRQYQATGQRERHAARGDHAHHRPARR